MIFQDIVVPLDGSRFAEAALPSAIRLARSAQARLHLLLAHEPVASLVGLGESFPPPEFDESARERAKVYLAGIESDLLKENLSWVETHEVDGHAGPALCEETARLHAGLVVMATHGRGAMGRFWLGSVADYLIRHLAVPVLMIHPARKGELPENPLRSILVALDLSQDAEAILEPVIMLAHLGQGHVTLLHVVEPVYGVVDPAVPFPPSVDPALLEESRAEAQRYLDKIADRLRLRGVSVATRVVAGARPVGGLLETLEQGQFDLIAMTTHGRGGLRRVLLGSVADRVIRGAGKPVLVLRPPPLVA
jgi:nucleotide-binding universal stress UspA family protein